MQWLNDYRMRLMAIGFVAVIALGGGSAKADFTFGEPTNLGATVNSSAREQQPSISDDGLSLCFKSLRPGGYGDWDLWMTTRPMTTAAWAEPVNLGPAVNTSYRDSDPSISADSLCLFFHSDRPGGFGDQDLWMTTRATTEDEWGEAVNLGPIVNSSNKEACPGISADGLSLYFQSTRAGSVGPWDIWISTRLTTHDPWGEPVNLGPIVNSGSNDNAPDISADDLSLFFQSRRPGGYGWYDLWMTTRVTIDDPWADPVNLGPIVNTSDSEGGPTISADGSSLYFDSARPGGVGDKDIWQMPIVPIVDLNGDGIVDSADMCIMVDHWGTNEPLCDIGPMPWGDGIVDVQDLIVLAEHLFDEFPPVESVR